MNRSVGRPRFPRVRVGVSSCLLGQEVRYDGGHKRDRFVTETLAEYVDFVPLCPEVGIGMGVPRPPIRLVGDPLRPRAVGAEDAWLDVTERLAAFARRHVHSLRDISGYILKKDSPSCGMEGVKVYDPSDEAATREGVGIFARELMEGLPLLPVEDERRLDDPVLRESFVTRIFVYHRWQQLVGEGVSPGRLIAFHADHKYLLMAHSRDAYLSMGQMLSNLARANMGSVAIMYGSELMTALGYRADRKGHADVLQHIMGYFKRSIEGGDKVELANTIEAYRRGEVPLVVPVGLLRRHLRRHPVRYLERQHYLWPHPDELGLLNAI